MAIYMEKYHDPLVCKLAVNRTGVFITQKLDVIQNLNRSLAFMYSLLEILYCTSMKLLIKHITLFLKRATDSTVTVPATLNSA